MLLSYQECLEKYGTDYKIKKSVHDGKLYIKEKGIYSDKEYVSELEIISKKYPNAIITLNSAFYYYGLTDTIPDFYYVATPKNTRKISVRSHTAYCDIDYGGNFAGDMPDGLSRRSC